MPDPFSGSTGSTKQELNILTEARFRPQPKGQTYSSETDADDDTDAEKGKGKGKGKKEKSQPSNVATLYDQGIKLLEKNGYTLILEEGGFHVNHRIMKPKEPDGVKGITYPPDFKPLQDIHSVDELDAIDSFFNEKLYGKDLREFWKPLFTPQSAESPLSCFTDRALKMKKTQKNKELHDVLNYGHTFDPIGRYGGSVVISPKIWVPDEQWFNPIFKKLKFSDVFTIFPPAEQEMLKLIMGRVGVGRTNHLPPGMTQPVSHTARMAAVIVGKDAG